MIDYTPTIIAMADRVRRNGPEGITLGVELREAIRQAWREDSVRDDCRVIMDAFSADFPLMGARQAE